MQRHIEVIRDGFGNPWEGTTLYVYTPNTTTPVGIYAASDTTDNATTVLTQPITTSANGRIAFAVGDGDYDLVYAYPDGTTYTAHRVNFFDGTTASAAPFTTVALSMPAEFSVTGSPSSPGGTITVSKATETANFVWAGPVSGGAAVPAFRALVAADITPVAVDITTVQTVGGAKTWSAAQTFSSTTAHTGASTFASTVGITGKATFDGNIDLSKGTTLDIDGTTGYGMQFAQLTSATTGAPVSALVQTAIYAYAFPDAATTNCCGFLNFPEGYEAGSDFIPFVMWCPGGTNTGNCLWGLEYSGIKGFTQGAFPAPTTITKLIAASAGVQNELYTTPFSTVTGTAYEVGSTINFRLYRSGADGTDTMTQSAFLMGFGIFYKKNRMMMKNTTPPFYT